MKYIVFGAGNNSRIVIEKMYKIMCKVECIVDNNEKKWGKKILGLEIKKPEYLDNINTSEYKIIISVVDLYNKEQIAKELIKKGFVKNRDFYFESDIFLIEQNNPGRVSGYIGLPSKYDSIKTFDPSSRLITVKNGKKIFRVIASGYESRYLQVYEKCKKLGLLGNYIVDTKITDTKFEKYGLVLEHEYIEPITYCFEWSPKIIFDYARFMTDLFKILDDNGLGLEDGHVLNTTIYKGDFLYIDFGSLKIGKTNYNVFMEFINTHILPLILFGRNQVSKAYMHLKNPGVKFDFVDVKAYLDSNEIKDIEKLYNIALSVKENKGLDKFVKLSKKIIDYYEGDCGETTWMGYQDDEWNWSGDLSNWSDKMINAISMIKTTKITTIIDMAGNMGWYGTYLHKELNYSIIMDMDYACIDNLWSRIQKEKVENVYPVYMSICSPTLPYYRDEPISKLGVKAWRKGANERLKADMVIALAIIHHLVFRQQLTFEEIIEQFASFSSKYLLIEYINIDDKYIYDFNKDGFDWYTKENFLYELNKKFRVISEAESTPKETRVLYLCEKY